jgi:hypothetical protein
MKVSEADRRANGEAANKDQQSSTNHHGVNAYAQ